MNLWKYTCPLCSGSSENFYNQEFQKCSVCQSVFRCPDYYLSSKEEKSRYEEHNNDVHDIRYQDFVSPIVDQVLANHTNETLGLDFGCGTGPVITHLLEQKGFQMSLYDPFFHNQPELSTQKYDFIIACEVIEHFHKPKKEFRLLYKLLNKKGKLYLMTDLYTSDIDFTKWYYKNDPTHVFFYSDDAFSWIQKKWNWKKYSRKGRCIILEK